MNPRSFKKEDASAKNTEINENSAINDEQQTKPIVVRKGCKPTQTPQPEFRVDQRRGTLFYGKSIDELESSERRQLHDSEDEIFSLTK